MNSLLLLIWLMSFLIVPSRQHVRAQINPSEDTSLDCFESGGDGRRAAQESAYAPRADLDLHSSDRLIHCRSLILDNSLRPWEVDRLLAEGQRFGTALSEDLTTSRWRSRNWELYVFLDPPLLGQKLAFALKTRLAEAGLSLYAQNPVLTFDSQLDTTGLASRCGDWDLNESQGRIFILRPSIHSFALRAGLCTAEGWTWL